MRLQHSTKSDYINANLVQAAKVETIVCQAPLEHTSEHFWQMCWEQHVPLVVMLTDFMEPFHSGGMREKCHKYFCDTKEQRFGAYEVRVADRKEIAPGWAKRTIVLTRDKTESREITHLHCTSWPDFGSLQQDQLSGLVQALDLMEQTRVENAGCRPVVHCSAGIGRSGTFVALEALLVLAKEKIWDDVDPLKVVPLLRNQRPGLVQTADQYGMIYQVLLSILSPHKNDII